MMMVNTKALVSSKRPHQHRSPLTEAASEVWVSSRKPPAKFFLPRQLFAVVGLVSSVMFSSPKPPSGREFPVLREWLSALSH